MIIRIRPPGAPIAEVKWKPSALPDFGDHIISPDKYVWVVKDIWTNYTPGITYPVFDIALVGHIDSPYMRARLGRPNDNP